MRINAAYYHRGRLGTGWVSTSGSRTCAAWAVVGDSLGLSFGEAHSYARWQPELAGHHCESTCEGLAVSAVRYG